LGTLVASEGLATCCSIEASVQVPTRPAEVDATGRWAEVDWATHKTPRVIIKIVDRLATVASQSRRVFVISVALRAKSTTEFTEHTEPNASIFY
jgi:hypothetical protein